MARPKDKKLNAENEEEPRVREIILIDNIVESVEIRSFKDLPWINDISSRLSSKFKELFRR